MDVTNSTRSLIIQAIRNKGITQTQLAQKMGYGKAWASKLLNGSIKRLSDDDTEKLEDFLGIQFFAVTKTEKVSGLAIELSKAAEDNPRLAKALSEILSLVQDAPMIPPYFTTAQLVGLGEEIIRLAHAEHDKPGKVGRKVLEMVSADPNKRKPTRKYKAP